MTDQDLAGKNATFTNPVAYANMIAEHDRVVSYQLDSGRSQARLVLLTWSSLGTPHAISR